MGNEIKIILTAVDKASAVLNKAGENVKKTGMDWEASYLAVGAGAAVAVAFLRSSIVEAKESAKIQAGEA